jgi:hypothetical protein
MRVVYDTACIGKIYLESPILFSPHAVWCFSSTAASGMPTPGAGTTRFQEPSQSGGARNWKETVLVMRVTSQH